MSISISLNKRAFFNKNIIVYRILFAQGTANVNQIWGLVVLLVSKLAGYPVEGNFTEKDFDKDTGILKCQRTLAESVEITSSANEIHRDGILNMQHYQVNGMSLDGDSQMVFGNKVELIFISSIKFHSKLLFFCIHIILDGNFRRRYFARLCID
jgi:hypothetical protein